MLNVKQIRDRVIELDSKHHGFFKAANASTISFIDIHENGKITFKPGIKIDSVVWRDIKDSLDIEDTETDISYEKNPKEDSKIFHSFMKASLSKPKTAMPERGASEQLAESLKQDLLKSIRGNKDEVYIESGYIVVKIPASENLAIAKSILIPIVNTSMVSHHANRAAVKITDGKELEILSWGF